jgi:signal recognition particle receptor subunit beta
MKEIKLVFTGSMGAGKTTAISAISEIPVINTDVRTIGEDAERKKTTTAAMDYGELTLDDGNKLRLYGTPGQERFQYMWPILIKGALGLIILVDDSNSQSLKDLELFINYFRDHINKIPTVVGYLPERILDRVQIFKYIMIIYTKRVCNYLYFQ